jgi:hypothetical protein
MESVERVADLVGDAGCEQGQGLDSFAFDGFEGLLAGFSGVVKNQCNTRAAGGLAVQWSGVKAQKTGPRIMDFEFVPHNPLATCLVKASDFFPLELWNKIRDRLTLDVWLEAEKTGSGLVGIKNPASFIDDQYAVLNDVEERLKKRAFASQPLNDSLQAFRVEPVDTSEDLVEETGFYGHKIVRAGECTEVKPVCESEIRDKSADVNEAEKGGCGLDYCFKNVQCSCSHCTSRSVGEV